MKKLLAFVFCFFAFAGYVKSADLVAESPIKGSGTPATIAISSTTLTKVPTSQTSGRMGIFINSPISHTGVVGFYGDCTSTALASTIRPIQISSTTTPAYLSLREDVCLWLLALQTTSSTSNIHVQEVKQ